MGDRNGDGLAAGPIIRGTENADEMAAFVVIDN